MRDTTPPTSTSPVKDTANEELYTHCEEGTFFDEDEPHNPVRGEMALWRAVITQALMDASSGSKKPENKYYKSEACHWLLYNNQDFVTVCHNAGLDPRYVRSKAREALARNCQWRAPAGSGPKKKQPLPTGKTHLSPTRPPLRPGTVRIRMTPRAQSAASIGRALYSMQAS